MINRDNLLKGILFLGYSGVIVYLIYSGKITKYINPKMSYYLMLASVIFLAMGLNYMRNAFIKKGDVTSNSLRKYFVYFIPLIIMVLLQPLSLNSALAKNKSFNITKNQADALIKSMDSIAGEKNNDSYYESSQPEQSSVEGYEEVENSEAATNDSSYIIYDQGQWVDIETLDEIIMTEENYMKLMEPLYLDPLLLNDKPIEITGFVLRNNQTKENQFVVARGLITCCLADASIVGLLATGDSFDSYEDNTWVRVKGKLDTYHYDGEAMPIIIAEEVEEISVPEQEYIYP